MNGARGAELKDAVVAIDDAVPQVAVVASGENLPITSRQEREANRIVTARDR